MWLCIIWKSYLQKETMMRNSFDLYSGLFVYNRFARQEVMELPTKCLFTFKFLFKALNQVPQDRLMNCEKYAAGKP